ncbi:MAG: acyltransferase [Rhodospirillales bacterium]|nr:acyltransferase [Rhodospirillales bacterium]
MACLDGLRGALAVYVMLSHLAPFAAIPPWAAGALSHGGAAVDVFFALSGMVIALSLDRFAWKPAAFLRARARRILPAYLAVLALAVAAQPLALPFARMPWIAAGSPARAIWSGGWPAAWAPELAAHLTMTHGLFPRAVLPDAWVSFLGAAWSLSTEWQFYALLAALAAWRGERARRLVLPLLLVLAGAGLGWAALASPGLHFSRAFLPNKAALFALGVAGAGWQARLPGAGLRYALVLGAALACGIAWGGAGKLAAPLVWTAALMAERGALPWLGAMLRLPAARWLGAVSYPLYLVNEPVQKLLGVALAGAAGGDAAAFTLAWLPLAAVVPLLAAWGLHLGIERRLLSPLSGARRIAI